MSESEFDDDRSGSMVDEAFTMFIESIELAELVSWSESWAFGLEAVIEAEAHKESRMSEASLLASTWVLRVWANKEQSRLLTSQIGHALLECDGYEMIQTKACRASTHLGPLFRAKSHSFDQETILAMSTMSLVSSLTLGPHAQRGLQYFVCALLVNEPCKPSVALRHAYVVLVLRMQYTYCYVILPLYCACAAHNRRNPRAACTLGGIVCMDFRSYSWSNG